MSFEKENFYRESESKKLEREKFVNDIAKLVEEGEAGHLYHSHLNPVFEAGGKEFRSDSPYSGFSSTEIKGLTELGKDSLEILRGQLNAPSVQQFHETGVHEVVYGGDAVAQQEYRTEKKEKIVKKGLFRKEAVAYEEKIPLGKKPVSANKLLKHGSAEDACRAIFHSVKLERVISGDTRPGKFATHSLLVTEAVYQRIIEQLRNDPASIHQLFQKISPEITEFVEEEKNINGKMFVALQDFSEETVSKDTLLSATGLENYKERMINYQNS